MTTEYRFKPVMTGTIRMLMEEHKRMAAILAKQGFTFDKHDQYADRIIAEIDRQEAEGIEK